MTAPGAVPTALVLRALALGDYLAGVPAYRALRRALPEHRFVLAAPAALAPLVALTDAVDELLPTGALEPVPWVGPPPDVAVNLHGSGPESSRLLEALTPRRLVAFANAQLPHVDGPTWDDAEHERVRWCRLVTSAFGGEADPDDVELLRPTTPSPAPGCVVVHPGAAYPARRWPAERYAAVARALAADADVVVTGSAAERPLAEEVATGAGLPTSAVLAGTTDLTGLTAVVAESALVVCGDTGPAHLASAFRTRSVVLFGPTPPSAWGPPARPEHHVLWRGAGTGDPHGAQPDPALLALGVPEVLAAARDQLSRPQGPQVPVPSSRRPG